MKRLFLVSLFLCNVSYSQIWEPVVESETGTRYSYDSSSLKREGDIVTYWELVDYKKPLKSKDLVVTSSKSKIIQDCKNNRFKVSDLIDYDSHGGMGKIVNIEIVRQTNWYYGKPESINDVFMKLVCKKAYENISHQRADPRANCSPPKKPQISHQSAD